MSGAQGSISNPAKRRERRILQRATPGDGGVELRSTAAVAAEGRA